MRSTRRAGGVSPLLVPHDRSARDREQGADAPRSPSLALRPAFSLIEVILALTILLISLAAIGQLVDIGSDNGVQARFTARGTRLAEAKLAEAEAGFVDATSGSDGTFAEDDAAWSWSVASEPAGPANLYRVTVTVTRDLRGRPFQVTLTQLVLDPKVAGSAAQAEVPAAPTDDAEMGTMP